MRHRLVARLVAGRKKTRHAGGASGGDLSVWRGPNQLAAPGKVTVEPSAEAPEEGALPTAFCTSSVMS